MGNIIINTSPTDAKNIDIGRVKKESLPIDENCAFHPASPYAISKVGTDLIGKFFYEAYNQKIFITRMFTHTGPRRGDIFAESSFAKQIAMIEAGHQEPVIYVGNLDCTRTFQDCRDAVRAYWLLMNAEVPPGEYFNIAGEEAFKLTEVVDILLGFSEIDIKVETDPNRLRPIDADYQMFDNTKIRNAIDWKPEIPVRQTLLDLLNHWRDQINKGKIPLNR